MSNQFTTGAVKVGAQATCTRRFTPHPTDMPEAIVNETLGTTKGRGGVKFSPRGGNSSLHVEISGVKTSVFAREKNGVKNGVDFFATMFSTSFFFTRNSRRFSRQRSGTPPGLVCREGFFLPHGAAAHDPAALTGGQGVLPFEVSGMLPIVLEKSRRRGLLAPLSVPIATSGLQGEQPL